MTAANDNGLGVPPGNRVYLVVSPEQNAAKIGFSGDVPRRVRDLDQGPYRINLVAHVPGDRRTEMAFLASFPGRGLRGEWFRDDGLFTHFVAKHMRRLCTDAEAEMRFVTQIEAMDAAERAITRHAIWMGRRVVA